MKGQHQMRILVVDDHFVVRMGIKASINAEADMIVVAEAANGSEAVEQWQRHKPDLTLMDLRLPGFDGVAATTKICEAFPEAIIVVLTTTDIDEDVRRALEAGARAYVLKTVDRGELLETIRSVHDGEYILPAPVAASLARTVRRPKLTEREDEILRLLVKGLNNKEIGAAISIGEPTVKRHVGHLLYKLRVRDRTQAVVEAIRRGLVHLDL